MPRHDCPFEPDVIAAVRTGRWPFRCERGLAEHVESCPVCSDVALVATAFSAEVDESLGEPALPSSSTVWWRAQRQAREEALRRATWPVRAAQLVAAACGAGAVAAVAGLAAGWLWRWVEWFTGLLPVVSLSASGLYDLPLSLQASLLVGLLAALVLAPAVIYLGLADE